MDIRKHMVSDLHFHHTEIIIMIDYSLFVGIDVSKKWLDVSWFSPSTGEMESNQIDDTFEVIKTYVLSLSCGVKEILFCLENTGRYSDIFLEASVSLNLMAWLEHPLQIKRSQGMSRGKTDQLDSERIAEYSCRFRDKANIWKPASNGVL